MRNPCCILANVEHPETARARIAEWLDPLSGWRNAPVGLVRASVVRPGSLGDCGSRERA